ncbi:hypothetical protein LTS10_007116 [Elasticomyces elasticus]|nr:hypothetical protein LTS10_007116 [Elasticomyces elasticus]
MTTDGPRQAVFATAELIENILMNAPVKSIFGSQRVSRQFRDVVATSVNLQQRMFLRPPQPVLTEVWTLVPKSEDEEESEDSDEEYCIVRVPASADLTAITASIGVDQASLRLPVTVLNPCLKLHELPVQYQPTIIERMENPRESLLLNVSERMLLEPGTWRSMYLTDQPCKRALVCGSWRIKCKGKPLTHGVLYVDIQTQSPHGFTLGALLDSALRAYFPSAYTEGKQWIDCHESLDKILERLEGERGTKAVLSGVAIEPHNTVVPNKQEQTRVQDIRAFMMHR